MSSTAFDSLLSKHPLETESVGAFARALRWLLARNPTAVLESTRIAQVGHLEEELAKDLLVELLDAGALRARLQWMCPNGAGVSDEADQAWEFPEDIECDACGARHLYDDKDVEVALIASATLAQECRPDATP